MYRVRRWSVRHARFLGRVYKVFESCLIRLHPLFNLVGYKRLEKFVVPVERVTKGFLFDSQMCGQCTLSKTGMSCPMNCPKTLRNGPCGGVLSNGNCEVKPEMRCVWVEAFEGSQRMVGGDLIRTVQLPTDNRLRGTSSWLREVREKVGYVEAGEK